MTRVWGTVFSVLIILSCSSCSPTNAASQEGLIGALFGGGVGAGIGSYFGKEFGHETENIAINSGIGAGLGLMAGALIHDINQESERKKAVIIRQAKMIGENQTELDRLREEYSESTKWGRSEVRPWKERYWGDNPGEPYLGPAPK